MQFFIFFVVIFFADVKLEWDNFRSTLTANLNSRTVVTENPNINEAVVLRKYARTAPIQPTAVLEHFAQNLVDGEPLNNFNKEVFDCCI